MANSAVSDTAGERGTHGSVLVVGGSRGLGAAIVRHHLGCGERVVVWSRSEPAGLGETERLAWKRVQIGAETLPVQALPADVRLVYNCAAEGIYAEEPAGYSLRDLQKVVTTNLIGGADVLLRLLDVLPPGSRFAHVSSLTARVPSQGWSIYGATKAGLEHLIESVRPIAAQRAVSITVCYPGVLATTFHANARTALPDVAVNPELIVVELARCVRLGQPRYVAPMDEDVLAILDGRAAEQRALASIKGLK